ncbi:MAG: endonuclease VIII [Clostridiales bacterium]|nr:endonuclease VIII [Clostridiales bacterium]
MLEIPEAKVLSDQIREAFAGRAVRNAVVNASPHKLAWYNGDPDACGPLLTGQTLDGAQPRGGQVELALGPVRLTLSDGVNIRRLAPGEPRPKTHQLLLEMDDGSALCCSVQMYGGLCAFREGTFDNPYYRAACDAPSPLGDAFTPAYFQSLRAGADKLSAKAFLATEQRVPGLGNGVLQDILHVAGLNPKRRMASVSASAFETLYRALTGTLREMAALGGRDVETDLYGRPGGYHTRCSRKTEGTPCPVCGTVIVKESYMGGAVYYCPTCQPARG